MKVLIFLLVFLIYPFHNAFSQIKTGGSLELGYEDRKIRLDDNAGTTYQSLWLKENEFAKINLNADYKKFSIYTGVKSYFQCEKIHIYDPLQVEYTVGINYKINCFLFKAEHMCSHSIESKSFYESYDKFSVEIYFGNKK
ncbi:MAG: hypothetical protein ACP5NZ_01750 [Nanobdellota archaeon]